jgi:hypothetical protein
VACLLLGSLALTACTAAPARTTPTSATPTTPLQPFAVPAPGPLEGGLLTSDVLITGSQTLSDTLVERVGAIKGIAGVTRLGLASLSMGGRTLTIAAVDPATYRRFAPAASAQTPVVWERVAGGEVAIDPGVSKRLLLPGDLLRLGNQSDAPEVHVGAFAPLSERIHAVVNAVRGEQLGIPVDNALLVSTGSYTPSALMKQIQKAIGDEATIQTLALEFDVDVPLTAVLSGTGVQSSVGSFTYVAHGDGTITPNASWVNAYIRTQTVPILGSVTCNKAIFPQLRAALTEIKDRGLAKEIHPDEYAGCYYPRFIGRDPANGLSLHSWGIAFDLNVPGNLRGTKGQIHPQVVAIFKRWGFAWGGDWSYTDPMHFELATLVSPH